MTKKVTGGRLDYESDKERTLSMRRHTSRQENAIEGGDPRPQKEDKL